MFKKKICFQNIPAEYKLIPLISNFNNPGRLKSNFNQPTVFQIKAFKLIFPLNFINQIKYINPLPPPAPTDAPLSSQSAPESPYHP